jgi:hypothetical protein
MLPQHCPSSTAPAALPQQHCPTSTERCQRSPAEYYPRTPQQPPWRQLRGGRCGWSRGATAGPGIAARLESGALITKVRDLSPQNRGAHEAVADEGATTTGRRCEPSYQYFDGYAPLTY